MSAFRPKFIKKADRQAKAGVDVDMKQSQHNKQQIQLDFGEEDTNIESDIKKEDAEMKSDLKAGFMQRKKV